MADTKEYEQAEKRRDKGMKRAVDHADAVEEGWSERAMRALRIYCRYHKGKSFLSEDVRDWAETKGYISIPPDARSWGAIFQTAAKAGVIWRIGYSPAKSSNLSPKCLWAAA